MLRCLSLFAALAGLGGRLGGSLASPPAPVAAQEDFHYPVEEPEERSRAEAALPSVVHVSKRAEVCTLLSADGSTEGELLRRESTFSSGGLVWEIVALVPGATPTAQPAVALEVRFKRWSLLAFLEPSPPVGGSGGRLRGASPPPPLLLRQPIGALSELRQESYNFTGAQPDYFRRAADDPADFLGARILADAPDGEPTFLDSMKYLPPTNDYALLGQPTSPNAWQLATNGRIKPSDAFNQFEPVNNKLGGGKSADGRQAWPRSAPPRRSRPSAPRRPRGASATSWDASTVFDPLNHTGYVPPPPNNVTEGVFSDYKLGLLGGHLRAAALGCLERRTGQGFEMMVVAPELSAEQSVLVRLRETGPNATHSGAARFFGAGEASRTTAIKNGDHGAAAFYGALRDEAERWQSFFAEPTAVSLALPAQERRQLDMARAAIVSSVTNFNGSRPNYGTGLYYMNSPPVRAMNETAGVPDGLPLTQFAIDHALLDWGLFDTAKAYVGFFMDTFVYRNGSIDMGHWKDPWSPVQCCYNCTFPDGLSDHGRVLDLFARVVRLTRDEAWLNAHAPAAARIGEFLLMQRQVAEVERPDKSKLTFGMQFGPAEHDTCQDPNFYFSTEAWSWRGMSEFAALLLDFGPALPASYQKLGLALAAEADTALAQLTRAAAASVVKLTGPKDPKGAIFFPAVVGAGAVPYDNMTQDTLASYSNVSFASMAALPPLPRAPPHPPPRSMLTTPASSPSRNMQFRYFAEMLSAGAFAPSIEAGLMDFRESHGGTLSGMTRYTDHLDDMPAIGYAIGGLAHDRLARFHLLLYGHMANYQSRGSFFSTEQMSLYGEGGFRTNDLGQLQAGFCVPSQTLVARMTAMQFVSEAVGTVMGARDGDGRGATSLLDPPTVWLARAAPRRWYGPGGDGFRVERAPTRLGAFSFAMSSRPAPGAGVANVTIAAQLLPPPPGAGQASDVPSFADVKVRVRELSGGKAVLVGAVLSGAEGVHVTVESVLPLQEIVVLRVPLPELGSEPTSFAVTLHATFAVAAES